VPVKVTQLSRAEFVTANYSTLDISVMLNYQYLHRQRNAGNFIRSLNYYISM